MAICDCRDDSFGRVHSPAVHLPSPAEKHSVLVCNEDDFECLIGTCDLGDEISAKDAIDFHLRSFNQCRLEHVGMIIEECPSLLCHTCHWRKGVCD